MTLQILMPIGPRDSYFPESDYYFPKPLVEIAGTPMIERVVRALQSLQPKPKFIFTTQDEDCRRFSLDSILQLICEQQAAVIKLRHKTQGAVASCLLAIDAIDPEQELVIANSDQVIDIDLSVALQQFRQGGMDAGVLSLPNVHPRWSYIRLDDGGQQVIEAAEKRVISRNAIAGFYWFRRAGDFFDAANNLILDGITVDGKYYIAPCLNYLVLADKKIGHYRIDKSRYHSWYKPDAIKYYEEEVRFAAGRD